MTGMMRVRSVRGCVWLVAMLLLVTAGCSTLKKDNKDTTTTSATASTKQDKNKPVYLDFDDVLLPKELKIIRDESFVYQTAGFTVGILSMKARVEINSLIEFFEKNMRKDNWQLLSEFKSPQTMMLFQKENRWCVINITEGSYNTLVRIWVAPMAVDATSGLLK
jgi:hypothetical protein